MTLATLSEILQPALEDGYAVAGLVALGWEDSRAYVTAAEQENVPIVLQAGPACRAHTPVAVIGPMLRYLAETASVPVAVHLDHGHSYDECSQAIDCGFTSVMFDGSRLPLTGNIKATAEIARLAHSAGLSCEGEIGFVGYADGAASLGTNPEEARVFASETGVDAIAVSVGNTHLQEAKGHGLNLDLIRQIEAKVATPLVIHGGSGVPEDQRVFLAANSRICKFNIGTELRRVFGNALRSAINKDPTRFDRTQLLADTHDPVVKATRSILRGISKPEFSRPLPNMA